MIRPFATGLTPVTTALLVACLAAMIACAVLIAVATAATGVEPELRRKSAAAAKMLGAIIVGDCIAFDVVYRTAQPTLDLPVWWWHDVGLLAIGAWTICMLVAWTRFSGQHPRGPVKGRVDKLSRSETPLFEPEDASIIHSR